ncbi:MAG: ribosome assembly cofactor RimP [Bacteroidales bacterium]|nr:ribosome assembly cofactor RimP [Bacteroidales bacterium]MDD4671608.1 ribosome assembly cofactor RimP [Bacteroidales bacterium]
MITNTKVENIVLQQLDSKIEFIVDISVSSANQIKVLLDGDQGITIERCVEISRAIEQSFDREAEDFELEVSSAGLSETLRLPRQYKKNIGHKLDVVKTDGQKVRGLLKNVTDSNFTLEIESMVKVEGKKRKQKLVEQVSIPYTDVKSALVVISFR